MLRGVLHHVQERLGAVDGGAAEHKVGAGHMQEGHHARLFVRGAADDEYDHVLRPCGRSAGVHGRWGVGGVGAGERVAGGAELAAQEVVEGLDEVWCVLCVHVVDALETFEGALAAGEDVFVREQIVLALLGAAQVEHDVHECDVLDACVDELLDDGVNAVAGPLLVPQCVQHSEAELGVGADAF